MHPHLRACALQQQRIRRRAKHSDAYTFLTLLTSPGMLDRVESFLPKHRERRFPPTETFLCSCRGLERRPFLQRAVNEAAVKRLIGGLPRLSTHTGAYCRARARLPGSMVSGLRQHTGQRMSASATAWRWHGHPVRGADGDNGGDARHPGESGGLPATAQRGTGSHCAGGWA